MLALFLKVSAFSFSVWKLSEGVIVPCSVFALSMLIVMFSENSICAPIRTGGKRRRKRRSKDRFIGEKRKSRFADTARRWGMCPEVGVVFLRLSSDQWTHGARCLMVVKWWPS